MAKKSKTKRAKAAGDKVAKAKAKGSKAFEGEPDTEISGQEGKVRSKGQDTSPTWSKTVCPVSREDFLKSAGNLVVEVADQRQVATAREFSSGSFGWFLNGKFRKDINGETCKVQMNCSFVVVGSKPPKEAK